MRNRILIGSCLLIFGLMTACSSRGSQRHVQSSVLDFLYPQGKDAASSSEVTLRLPLRVGLAFAPSPARVLASEAERNGLLERVAASFRDHPAVGHLEVVPGTYLKRGGGFENLDQLRATFGFDVMALVSYDQVQHNDSTRASGWTYLTIVGPLFVDPDRNETRTLLDASIFDIESRTLLFRAAGDSKVEGRSSWINEERKQRRDGSRGFEIAADSLIGNLDAGLAEFSEQSRSGTVRGPGTPALSLYDSEGQLISGSGSRGAGAFGAMELLLLTALAAPVLRARSRRRRASSGR